MSIEYMKRISAAEEEAVSVRRQAQTDARKLAEQGRKDAEQLLEQAKKKAEAAYQEVIRNAEAEAQKAYDKRLAEVAAEGDAMKKRAAEKLPSAVKVITGKVVNLSGDS